uniref:FHOD1 N-terminal GTPase-binding domain-containing protein n=1 Tax=Hippocampus comes TaxID=109280 RepID=A0A3Q2YPV6_HIPCM
MSVVTCRVQFLLDQDPFICTNFPEPRRPPSLDLDENAALNQLLPVVHKLLDAPLKVSEAGGDVSLRRIPLTNDVVERGFAAADARVPVARARCLIPAKKPSRTNSASR